jgi:hypothetical protein
MAGRVRTKAGESLPDQGGEESSFAHPEVTVAGTEKPRWSAERRRAFAKARAAARRMD